MRKIYLYYLIIFFSTFLSDAYSQAPLAEKYTKPLCIIDLNFGYAAPSFDFAGSRIKDFYDFTGYGISNGFNANFTTKFAVVNFKTGQIRPYLTISYAEFHGDENKAYNIGGFIIKTWPRTGMKDTSILYDPATQLKDTSGKSSIVLHSPFLAIGWEIAFFTDRERRSVINFGTDFNITFLWGKISDQPTGKLEIYNNIDKNVRMGLGLNLGYSYRVANMLGLSLGTRMQITNLFSKDNGEMEEDGNLILNDKKNTGINKYLKENRSIGFFGIYGGVTFFIGGSK